MTTRQNLQVRPWPQAAAEAHTGAEEKPMTDHLHLVQTPQGWQIVNAFFRMTEGGAP